MAGAAQSALWRCPTCGRGFAKKNQWHSCLTHSVEDHFRRKDPRLKATYDLLLSRLEEIGPVRTDAVKTSINLIAKYHFTSVTVQRNSVRLGFVSARTIESPRITNSLELGPTKIEHSVRLDGPDDIDDEFLGWLWGAYTLQS